MTNMNKAMTAEVLAGEKHSKKQQVGALNVTCRRGLNCEIKINKKQLVKEEQVPGKGNDMCKGYVSIIPMG